MALTFPSSPTNGQLYTDTTTGNRYIYNATVGVWSFSSNNVGMSVSSTPPSNVAPGAMWFNREIGRTFVYYDDGDSKQWIETVPAGTVDTNTIASYVNPVFASMNGAYTTANGSYVTANAAYNAANNVNLSAPYNTANAAFDKANTALQNGSITLAGSLTTTGSITSSSRGITKGSMPAGSILQVVSVSKTDTWTASIASPNWTDIPGLSVNITPTSSSSKIFINLTLYGNGTAGASQFYYRFMRDSTPVGIGDAGGSRTRSSGRVYIADGGVQQSSGQSYLDSPATTSTITYKVQATTEGGTYSVYLNRTPNDADGSTSNGQRHISTITVMEIAQ